MKLISFSYYKYDFQFDEWYNCNIKDKELFYISDNPILKNYYRNFLIVSFKKAIDERLSKNYV